MVTNGNSPARGNVPERLSNPDTERKPNVANDNKAEITAEYLKQLAEDIGNSKQKQSDASTSTARLYKTAEKTHGLHNEAMKLCVKLKSMSTEKKDDFLRALNEYVPLLELEPSADLVDRINGDDNLDEAA